MEIPEERRLDRAIHKETHMKKKPRETANVAKWVAEEEEALKDSLGRKLMWNPKTTKFDIPGTLNPVEVEEEEEEEVEAVAPRCETEEEIAAKRKRAWWKTSW
jgi:hypothetical protein